MTGEKPHKTIHRCECGAIIGYEAIRCHRCYGRYRSEVNKGHKSWKDYRKQIQFKI